MTQRIPSFLYFTTKFVDFIIFATLQHRVRLNIITWKSVAMQLIVKNKC